MASIASIYVNGGDSNRVIPAKAGTQSFAYPLLISLKIMNLCWIPAL